MMGVDRQNNIRNNIHRIQINKRAEIPKIVWLLENPRSLVSLPGKISLYNHDSLHLLLEQKTNSTGEAFVLGFTIGNDLSSKKHHVFIFKFFLQYVYPKKYRLSTYELIFFDIGLEYGKRIFYKNINKIDFKKIENYPLSSIRAVLGIDVKEIGLLVDCIHEQPKVFESTKLKSNLSNYINIIRILSSCFAIIGGFLLALNIESSSYGFIFLAISSFSLLFSAILQKDRLLIFYSGSVFFSVDLLGIYRWIL